MGEIAKFIVFIGPISSIFDYTTYLHHVVCLQLPGPAPRSRCSTPAGSSNR